MIANTAAGLPSAEISLPAAKRADKLQEEDGRIPEAGYSGSTLCPSSAAPSPCSKDSASFFFDGSALLWPSEELQAQLAMTAGCMDNARGPHARSNWVPLGLPSRFIAGSWPFLLPGGYGIAGPESQKEGEAKARSLLEAGVTTFVNLTRQHEIGEEGSYETWMPRLQEMEKEIHGEDCKTQLRFDILCEMPDGGVSYDCELAALLKRCLEELEDPRRMLYVHCYGGHGRTGIVTCSLLLLLYPESVLLETPEKIRSTWGRANIKRHTFMTRAHEDFPKDVWERAVCAVAIFNRFHAERLNEEGGGLCRFPHSSEQIEQVARVAQGLGPFKELRDKYASRFPTQ